MGIDRRVAQTRTALYDGLVALILRKDYDDISAQDILKEADVSRSTFYAHFISKDELLERSLGRLRALLIEGHDHVLRQSEQGEAASRSFSLAMFEHVAEYKRVYDVITGKPAGAIVLKAQRDVLISYLKNFSAMPKDDEVPRELMIEYVAGTIITIMKWWVDRRVSLSPREIDAMFHRLVSIPVAASPRPPKTDRKAKTYSGS